MWSLLALSMAAAVGALGYRMAERDGRFDLGEARIRGIRSADSAAVADALRGHFGTPLGSLETASVERALGRLPMVDSVDVLRSWPDAITVDVRLVRPVAVADGPEGRRAVDRSGRALPGSFLSDTLPEVTLEPGYAFEDLQRLLAYMDGGGLPSDVEGVEVGPVGVCFRTGDWRVVLGSSSLSVRWDLFRSIPRSAILTGGECTVDMRFRGQAVVRPLAGGSS
jgi:hypothetical protein